jgi:hypothetical protein
MDGVFLMVWTSSERHILIFHSNIVQTVRDRLLFHYMVRYYIILPYDPTIIHCGVPCFYNVIPILLIVLFSL